MAYDDIRNCQIARNTKAAGPDLLITFETVECKHLAVSIGVVGEQMRQPDKPAFA